LAHRRSIDPGAGNVLISLDSNHFACVAPHTRVKRFRCKHARETER
jgi:hypothetical protein